MRAEIIATGAELLTGGIVETNSAFLSEELLLIGLEPAFRTIVGDSEQDMEEALGRALERADAVIVTGGLGPTEDDITRKVAAKIGRRRLVLNDDALAAIKSRLAQKGRTHAGSTDRQALIPAGARLLYNPVGTAPGFYFDEGATLVAALPGVPQEMEAMFSEGLRPVLAERFGGRIFYRRRVLHTFGMPESEVNRAIQSVLKKRSPRVGLTAGDKGVDVGILAGEGSGQLSQSLIEKTESEVRKQLGDAIYGVDGQRMEEVVGALLKQRRLTISVAESCTGGLISARLTSIAGSSGYFDRGAVVYSNRAKTEMLGVPAEVIGRQGAVSSEAAEAMARGIRESAGAGIGLAVTGIAGPGGGTADKPVGLVYLALASAKGVSASERRFSGTREQIRMRASQAALDMVRRHLIG